MNRRAIQIVLALVLVAAGWAVGRAQTPAPAPEFTLAIEAPPGRTTIRCVRGCTLQGGRDEGNPNNTPTPEYWYECRGTALPSCGSTVNGWLKH
jgi:hypothetical protein